MKSTLLVHGAWLAAAFTAFVVGAQMFPAGGDSDGARPDSIVAKDGQRAGGAKTDGAGALRKSGSRSEKLVAGPTAVKPPPLTDAQIAALGEQFRKATNPIERRLAFSKLLEGLTAENALLVREQIEHLDHRSAEFSEFHYAWGAVGGVNAIMFGADTEEDDMSPALAGWASSDPSAARAWFEKLDMESDAGFDALLKDREIKPNDLRNHLMRGLVKGIADSDPGAATEFLQAMAAAGNESAYHGMMHSVVESVMRTDPPAEAADWSSGIEDGKLRQQAMARVADHFARRDLKAATEWAMELSGQPENASAIAQVGSHMARRDPQKAVAWLNELPAGSGQNAGMARALSEWTGRDPGAASEYLTSMPPSPAKDSAISGFSRRLAWADPHAAIIWAESISSEEQRIETLIGAGRAWTRKDERGAAAWAAGSGLPEEVQEAILNPPKRDWD